MRAKFFAGAVGMLLAAGPVLAHHSIRAEFDETRPVTLRGTLTKMDWVNPHAWIYLDVEGPEGKVQTWAIETSSPVGLSRQGVSPTDFPLGIEFVVNGIVARHRPQTAHGRTLMLPDGRRIGGSPRRR